MLGSLFVFGFELVASAHPLSRSGEQRVMAKLARYNEYASKARRGEWNAEAFVKEFFPILNSNDRAWLMKNRMSLAQVREGLPLVDALVSFDAIRALDPRSGKVLASFGFAGTPGRLELRVNDKASVPARRSMALTELDSALREALLRKPGFSMILWDFVVPPAHANDDLSAGLLSFGMSLVHILLGLDGGGDANSAGSPSGDMHGGGDTGDTLIPSGLSGTQSSPFSAAQIAGSASELCKNAANNVPKMASRGGNCLAAVKKHVCDTSPSLCQKNDDPKSSPNKNLGDAYEPRWRGVANANNSAEEFKKLGFRPSWKTPQQAPEGSIVIWQSCGSSWPEGHIAVACDTNEGVRKGRVFISDTVGAAFNCQGPTVLEPPIPKF